MFQASINTRHSGVSVNETVSYQYNIAVVQYSERSRWMDHPHANRTFRGFVLLFRWHFSIVKITYVITFCLVEKNHIFYCRAYWISSSFSFRVGITVQLARSRRIFSTFTHQTSINKRIFKEENSKSRLSTILYNSIK